MKKLTQQHKLFVLEYINSLDAEFSAKKAGYKSKNLKPIIDGLLSDELIIKEIKRNLQSHIASLRVHKGYVVHKLLEIAEFSLQEEDILDKEGAPTGKRKLRDTTAGLRALEALCKYLGFSAQDDSQSPIQPKIVTIKNLDEEKI